MKKQNIKIIIKTSIAVFLIVLLLLGTFKKIRSLFPPPEINENLIGFAQYYGYPFYFDHLFFALIIIVPLIAILFLKKFL